jgi:hypothetical protein
MRGVSASGDGVRPIWFRRATKLRMMNLRGETAAAHAAERENRRASVGSGGWRERETFDLHRSDMTADLVKS